MKSMAFSDGNLNYKKVQEDSLNANIEIETRLNQGHKIAFGIYSVDPLRKSSKDSSGYSIKHPIEEIINKIEQNIKKEQYEKGETILIVDIKQLIIPSNLKEASVPFFVFGNSIVRAEFYGMLLLEK
ncbi:MAG: hypothetical protein IPK21_20590 [Haliscomenobacter sp.]|nr:hypothetical protein [Haliscomenobacter sp.]